MSRFSLRSAILMLVAAASPVRAATIIQRPDKSITVETEHYAAELNASGRPSRATASTSNGTGVTRTTCSTRT